MTDPAITTETEQNATAPNDAELIAAADAYCAARTARLAMFEGDVPGEDVPDLPGYAELKAKQEAELERAVQLTPATPAGLQAAAALAARACTGDVAGTRHDEAIMIDHRIHWMLIDGINAVLAPYGCAVAGMGAELAALIGEHHRLEAAGLAAHAGGDRQLDQATEAKMQELDVRIEALRERALTTRARCMAGVIVQLQLAASLPEHVLYGSTATIKENAEDMLSRGIRSALAVLAPDPDPILHSYFVGAYEPELTEEDRRWRQLWTAMLEAHPRREEAKAAVARAREAGLNPEDCSNIITYRRGDDRLYLVFGDWNDREATITYVTADAVLDHLPEPGTLS